MNELKTTVTAPVLMPLNNGIYRVKIGPFTELNQLDSSLNKIKRSGYPKAFKTNRL